MSGSSKSSGGSGSSNSSGGSGSSKSSGGSGSSNSSGGSGSSNSSGRCGSCNSSRGWRPDDVKEAVTGLKTMYNYLAKDGADTSPSDALEMAYAGRQVGYLAGEKGALIGAAAGGAVGGLRYLSNVDDADTGENKVYKLMD